MEERPLAKENTEQSNQYRTQNRENWPNGVEGVREVAKKEGKVRFTALLHHVTVDLLRDSYNSLKKKAAPGVDGVTWREYGQGLEARISDLHGRIHRGALWGISSATVEASLDPERRWAETAIGSRGAGRQSRAARGREGPQPDLGRGLSGLLVRIPAGAQSTGCTRCVVGGDCAQEGELDTRFGRPVIFRQSRNIVGWSSSSSIGSQINGSCA